MPAIRLADIRLPLADLSNPAAEEKQLLLAAAKKAGIRPQDIRNLDLVKKSLDARDKGRPLFVYTLDVEAKGRPKGSPIPPAPAFQIRQAQLVGPRPVVAGAGPAGLFAALALARAGLQPLVLEQGEPVDARAADVAAFWQAGQLDPVSNIQFGEGGAGAFSDGKLTSRSKDSRGRLILAELIACGADPAIRYWHRPHLGSDKLPGVIAALRQRIIDAGGEFCYQTRLLGLIRAQGRLQGLVCQNAAGQEFQLETEYLVLAAGNSARPLYQALAEQGIALEAKAFAVGLRIQQAQSLIDQAQYGVFANHPLLGAADYQLTWQDPVSQRGCYTFCNCPGGAIINASSSPGCLVVNGMSLAARDSGWANSAMVAQVCPGQDFGREVLGGVEYQYALERAAHTLGQGGVPLMSALAFLGQSSENNPDSSHIKSFATQAADLRPLFSESILASLQGALQHWARIIPGFTRDAVLAGVESRTSAPLRILRDSSGVSLNCPGLYPAGEGAGYAGGIVSSAIDGLKAAEALLEHYPG